MRYVLRPKEGSIPYQKITRGRKWVGRVTQHADGDYVAVIGKDIMVRARTAVLAFEVAAAKAMGYNTVVELKVANRKIRQRQAERRRWADGVVSDYFKAQGFDAKLATLDQADTPDKLIDLLGAFTRGMDRS